MIEFLFSMLFNIAIILFFLASLLASFSLLSYVSRTEDYNALFFAGGLNKWKELNLKEQMWYKKAFKLSLLSFSFFFISLAKYSFTSLT